jgi:DNA-binding transcriptional regulator YdaS (Cro superfamily)
VEGAGEIARRLGVSQPRVSQLVALTYLAPSIQAEIAAMEAVDGVEPMSERPLREVLRAVGWRGQARVFRTHNRAELTQANPFETGSLP